VVLGQLEDEGANVLKRAPTGLQQLLRPSRERLEIFLAEEAAHPDRDARPARGTGA